VFVLSPVGCRTEIRWSRGWLVMMAVFHLMAHTRFLLAKIALDVATTQSNIPVHRLEPRNVTTGGSWAARRAGT
jgi:hypothetical protein